MTDAAYVFHQDIREKKNIKNSANKKNRTGKGPVRFPSDYLTKKEIETMNGECRSWNMEKFYSWDEFKKMPEDIQIRYVNYLLNKYNCAIKTLSEVVFGKSTGTLRMYLGHNDSWKFINHPKKGFVTKHSDIERLKKDIEYQADTQFTHTIEDEPKLPDTNTSMVAPTESPSKPVMQNMSFEFDSGTNRESTIGYLAAIMNLFGDGKLHISMTISVEGSGV